MNRRQFLVRAAALPVALLPLGAAATATAQRAIPAGVTYLTRTLVARGDFFGGRFVAAPWVDPMIYFPPGRYAVTGVSLKRLSWLEWLRGVRS